MILRVEIMFMLSLINLNGHESVEKSSSHRKFVSMTAQ